MQTITTPEQRERFEKDQWTLLDEVLSDFPDSAWEMWLAPDNSTAITRFGDGRLIPEAYGEDNPSAPDGMMVLEFAAILGISPQGFVLVPVDAAEKAKEALLLAETDMSEAEPKWRKRKMHKAAEACVRRARAFKTARETFASALSQQGTVVPPSQSGGVPK